MSYFDVRLMLPIRKAADAALPPTIEIGLEESVLERAPAFNFLVCVRSGHVEHATDPRGHARGQPEAFHSRLGAYRGSSSIE